MKQRQIGWYSGNSLKSGVGDVDYGGKYQSEMKQRQRGSYSDNNLGSWIYKRMWLERGWGGGVWVSDHCLMPNFSARSWTEQITFDVLYQKHA